MHGSVQPFGASSAATEAAAPEVTGTPGQSVPLSPKDVPATIDQVDIEGTVIVVANEKTARECDVPRVWSARKIPKTRRRTSIATTISPLRAAKGQGGA